MKLDITVTVRMPEIVDVIRGLIAAVTENTAAEVNMANELDDLQAQVEQNGTVIDSAILLIRGLADQLAAAQNDPAKIQAIVTALRSKDQELGEAVANPGSGATA